jgi:PAS domain-containing protein
VNSVISLPLKAVGKVLGAISIYARQADAFDEHEVGLLSELADDLAYGLVALREKAERRRVEQELSLRQHAVDSSSNGIMISAVSTSDMSLIYVNPAFERITGYAAQEVIGRNPRFLAGDDLEQIGLTEIRAAIAREPAGAVGAAQLPQGRQPVLE